MNPPHPSVAPGPRGGFLAGHLAEFRRDVLGLLLRSAAGHGDIVRFKLGPQVIHLLNHPAHAAEVLQKRAANYDKNTRSSAFIRSVTGESLLTSNGEAWKSERRMVQPAFHHLQIARFAASMGAATSGMLERWRMLPVGPVDISSEMTRLTYRIVGRTLFSFDAGEESETIEKAMAIILPHVFNRLGHVINLPVGFPTPANRRFRRALDDVDRVVYQIIRDHRRARETGSPDADLLDLLLQMRDETGAGLSDTQLRNETITFLLAGHETTANALTWAFHLIAMHPEVEHALLNEITGVLGGRMPGLEDIPKLVFTKAVIQEAMRLYPPIWIIERRVIQADELGGCILPAGSSVVVSPYTLHRHPGFWKRPEVFDPSRFLGRQPDAYIPFGLGPRYCIGHEFAMLEARIIVAAVLQSFSLRMVPGHPVEPLPGITLRAKHGMMMTLHRRP